MGEAFRIFDQQFLMRQFDRTAFGKPSEYAVYMDGREAERVAHLLLSERNLASTVICQADDRGPHV